MNTAELFSGTKSFSSVMTKHGHKTFTVDNDARLEPDLCIDIFEVDNSLYNCDMLWASPPCEGFSVAVIGRNWNHDNTPKTESARIGMRLLKKTIEIIEVSKPTWWFIENPRGKMRKMDFLQEFVKRQGGVQRTITYCQYGDSRMKPTDIWTNALWWKSKEPCKNGNSCHVSAPRGSQTGTQGIKGAKDRGRIPEQLFEEILAHKELYSV